MIQRNSELGNSLYSYASGRHALPSHFTHFQFGDLSMEPRRSIFFGDSSHIASSDLNLVSGQQVCASILYPLDLWEWLNTRRVSRGNLSSLVETKVPALLLNCHVLQGSIHRRPLRSPSPRRSLSPRLCQQDRERYPWALHCNLQGQC